MVLNPSVAALTYVPYQDGDERELSEFHNRVYGNYAGTVHRSPEYWRWTCVERPEVHPEGVIVARRAGYVSGYVVVGDTGTVWDLVVGPVVDREDIARELLGRAEDHARARGASRLVMNVPVDDAVLRRVAGSKGFGLMDRSNVYMTFQDYPRILEALGVCSDARPVVARVSLKRRGKSDVDFTLSPSSDSDRHTRIEVLADGFAFDGVLVGRSPLLLAMLRRKIRIRPVRRTLQGYRYLRSLRITAPWFAPLGDVL